MTRASRGSAERQVELLNESLKSFDQKHPSYPLWVRLASFLGSICESIRDLQLAVRGDGNGTRGLLERVTVVEGAVKVTQSDIKEVLNYMRQLYGIDRDGVVVQYDKNNHPARRANDAKQEDPANRVLAYLVDKVLPPVIVWAVLGGLALAIAANRHLLGSP